MGDVICDECGEQPYLGQLTGDYDEYHDFEEEPDVEVWCECSMDRAIVYDDSYNFHRDAPDYWGPAGGRYVCYRCGEIPRMGTSVGMGSTHPREHHHFECDCDDVRSVGFEWRSTMPDEWKSDSDPTKWPDIRDDIVESLEQNGPMREDELADELDVPTEAVHSIGMWMRRENRLYRENGIGYMTPDMKVEHDTGTAPYQQDGDDSAYSAQTTKKQWSFTQFVRRLFR